MDIMQIENGYSFLLRDINRMLKKMNYDMVQDSVDGHPSHAAQVKKHKEGRHKSSSAFFILRLHP